MTTTAKHTAPATALPGRPYSEQPLAWRSAHLRAAKAYRKRQRAAGRCIVCGWKIGRSTRNDLCSKHAVIRRAADRRRSAKQVARRRAAGLCAWPYCQHLAVLDRVQCKKHLARSAARQRGVVRK